MPKCLFLEMVLPQHTEELNLNARTCFVLMEITGLCVIQPIKGGKGARKGRIDL